MSLEEMAKAAKAASYQIAIASTELKNKALEAILSFLQKEEKAILNANLHDIQEAQAAGLSEAMIDRLSLQKGLNTILSDIGKVIALSDPVGKIFEEIDHPRLTIRKQRTPLGVLGVIYESRPNVTIDISVLSLKSGNCAILRGGTESARSNQILVRTIQEAIHSVGLPKEAIQLVMSSDRAEVQKMLRLHQYIDLIIPRGGASLHQYCRENSTIPVITGGIGICHLFVDSSANLERSLPLIANAKVQRPTVCNALDTLLVHQEIADTFIPEVIDALGAMGVSFRLDDKAFQVAKQGTMKRECSLAKKEDWETEWLSLVLGIKIVRNIEEAIDHIRHYSTGHSDGILTENQTHADSFIATVDSAAVYVNASTRFTDGGELGLGAEVAISTQKLHARGPMGLQELTSYKWVISGDYAARN